MITKRKCYKVVKRQKWGILFYLLTGCYNRALDYKTLVESNRIVIGTVYATNCYNDGEFIYAFSINNKKYSNKANSSPVNRCFEMKRGENVKVYYYPKDPQINSILPPQEIYTKTKGFYMPLWIFFLFPFFSIPAGYFNSKKRKIQES